MTKPLVILAILLAAAAPFLRSADPFIEKEDLFTARRSFDDGQTRGPVQRFPKVSGPMEKNPVSLRLRGATASW